MPDFQPLNPLETELQKAQAGLVPASAFLRLLWMSDLFVSSGKEVQADWTGFQPMLFARHGVEMMVAFSAIERVDVVKNQAPYCLKIAANEFLRRMSPEFGLVLNHLGK